MGVLRPYRGLHLGHLVGLLCFWQIQYPDDKLADHAMICPDRPAVKHKSFGGEVGYRLTLDPAPSSYGVFHCLPDRCTAET